MDPAAKDSDTSRCTLPHNKHTICKVQGFELNQSIASTAVFVSGNIPAPSPARPVGAFGRLRNQSPQSKQTHTHIFRLVFTSVSLRLLTSADSWGWPVWFGSVCQCAKKQSKCMWCTDAATSRNVITTPTMRSRMLSGGENITLHFLRPDAEPSHCGEIPAQPCST